MRFQKQVTLRTAFYALFLALFAIPATTPCRAAAPPAFSNASASARSQATAAAGDVLVLANGDRITGTFVGEVGGKVNFHSDVLGDLSLPWEEVKEVHTRTRMVILNKGVTLRRGQDLSGLPQGTLSIEGGMITVHPANDATIPPIPLDNAEYIVDQATMQKQLVGHPALTEGWNGGLTIGLTAVRATQNQFNFAGSLALVRVVPSVSWLPPRNRTTFDYAQSYGKITQPAYTAPDGTFIPSTYTKSSILHVGAERDQYVSPRFYYLGMVSFDHNYSQSLDLQQIYGGGIGYTIFKTPVQELDVKAVLQYERQSFANVLPPASSSQSLIASTFGASYLRHISKEMLFTQQLLYIPAWNNTRAYSLAETDTLAFPAYKNFSFSLGTLDTYLNDVPLTFPNTKRNSFQFTAGVTYNIKSTY